MLNKKRSLSLVFITLILLANFGFISGLKAQMGNAKMVLYPEVDGKSYTDVERTIYTKNVNDVPIKIRLELTEEAKEFIELLDEEYILQPDDEKKARFIVSVKKEGTYNGKILVFFSPEDEDDKTPGVVLNSEITVIAKKDQDYEYLPEESEGVSTSPLTGNVVGDSGNGGIIFLSISTLLLVAILAILLYLIKTKKIKPKRKKK